MTLTPAYAAKLANARREVTELLTEWDCPGPESRASQIIDRLQDLGWAPPHADGDTDPIVKRTQPAAPDSPGRREFAEVRAALAARRAR